MVFPSAKPAVAQSPANDRSELTGCPWHDVKAMLRQVGLRPTRQRLALRFKACDDLLGVHAQLDDLERHAAAHRRFLLGHIDRTATAFADFLQHLIASDNLAHRFVGGVGKIQLHRRNGFATGLGFVGFEEGIFRVVRG